MPEGVEVRLLAEEIADLITGSKLLAIRLISGRYKKIPPVGLRDMIRKLPASVYVVGAAGKFMWWGLRHADGITYAMFTLGMAGAWTLLNTDYNRVEFVFGTRAHEIRLYLLDVRNFATVKFGTEADLNAKLSKLGRDMFSRTWTAGVFASDLDKVRDGAIADVLLGQKIVAGPGAYIIAEALYETHIAPARKVKSLTASDKARLYAAIRDIAKRSYNANKNSVSIYKLRDDIKVENKFQFKIYDVDYDNTGNKVHLYPIGDRNIKWVPAVQK